MTTKHFCNQCEREIPDIKKAVVIGSDTGFGLFVRNGITGGFLSNYTDIHLCDIVCVNHFFSGNTVERRYSGQQG